jgi:signal transduction histidine kinase
LNEGVEATLRIVMPLKKPEVNIDVRLGNIPRVECNLGKINQVILNLVSNAVQAMKGGGNIVVSTHPKDDGVELRVRDDGPGIPLEIQKRIFDPFFTTKPVGEGTGLGLSISRRIVESHHGTLTFVSQPGKGTEFLLWLPVRQPSTPIPSEPDDEKPSQT